MNGGAGPSGVISEISGGIYPGGSSGDFGFDFFGNVFGMEGFNIPDIRIPRIPDWLFPNPIPVVISEIPTEWPEWSLEPILETRPQQIPDPYPGSEAAGNVDPSAIIGPYQGADTPEQQEEEQVVAHDWGHLLRQGASSIFGLDAPQEAFAGPGPQTTAQTQAWLSGGTPATMATPGGDCDGMPWSGGTPPKGYKVVNYCGRGVLRKVRRRRRRRLLTASDSRDIATIVGLVGKGQMASALINRR